MSDVPDKANETPTAGPPVLMGDHLRVEVVCTPPAGSPFPPITMQVVPFTRTEGREYSAALDKLKDEAFEKEQCKRLAARIKVWDVKISRDADTAADINPGTVERLPPWAYPRIEAALFGEAGKLLGNSPACSA